MNYLGLLESHNLVTDDLYLSSKFSSFQYILTMVTMLLRDVSTKNWLPILIFDFNFGGYRLHFFKKLIDFLQSKSFLRFISATKYNFFFEGESFPSQCPLGSLSPRRGN